MEEADKNSTLSLWAQCDRLDTLFIIFCCATCWLVVPAIGLAFSGYSIRRNGLASYFPALLSIVFVSIQWWAWGYSIAFGEGNAIFGYISSHAFHHNVSAAPVGTIPEIVFSTFQMIFCATVCALAVGGAAERGRLIALVPFIILWATFVYCPLAHMVWTETGALASLGVLDFAGGTPVHICSGASATALSVYLSRPLFRSRRSTKRTPSHIRLHKPHNITSMLLAMVLIWSCWLPFESGTALALNFKAVMAFCVTNTAAASGSATWTLLAYLESGCFSLDAAVLGMIAGLVMITPAGGFVGMSDAVIMGVIGSVSCRFFLKFKSSALATQKLRWVDPADMFASHALGGVLATLATGLFASKEVAAYDGATFIAGGALYDGHWRQLLIQAVEAVVGATWSFCASYAIIALIDLVPGLEVLSTDEDLGIGMDKAQMLESLSGAHADDEQDEYEAIIPAGRIII